MWDPVVGNDLCLLNWISVNILTVILCYNFTRCYHGGNWVKDTWVSLYWFPQLHVNLQLIYMSQFSEDEEKESVGQSNLKS